MKKLNRNKKSGLQNFCALVFSQTVNYIVVMVSCFFTKYRIIGMGRLDYSLGYSFPACFPYFHVSTLSHRHYTHSVHCVQQKKFGEQ